MVAPGGLSIPQFWRTLLSGTSQVSVISLFDASEFPTQIAAQILGWEGSSLLSPKELRRTDRYTQFALLSAHEALKDAGLQDNAKFMDKVSVYEGSSLGPTGWFLDQHSVFLEKGFRRANPLTLVIGFPGAASAKLTAHFGISGASVATTGGSVSSIQALSSAFNSLRVGDADIALVVGAEAPIHPAILASFCTVNVMSRRNSEPSAACRPFDASRDGFVLGEGSGAVVLETEESACSRGVRGRAEIKSIAVTTDSYHLTAPEPSGGQIGRVMSLAISKANIDPGAIDYLNAHGTGTILNDEVEARAISSTFGSYSDTLPVTSIKGTIGHLLGACGIVELISSILSIENQEIPPTANFFRLDDGMRINVVAQKPLKHRIRTVMTNNYSFGGKNTSIVITGIDSQGH
jgi:3-oxoacyl-[acyl-carrier-protein] synthase II